jgi:hypothetical protein
MSNYEPDNEFGHYRSGDAMSQQPFKEVVINMGDYVVTCEVLAREGPWLMLRRITEPDAKPVVRNVAKLPICEFNDWVKR